MKAILLIFSFVSGTLLVLGFVSLITFVVTGQIYIPTEPHLAAVMVVFCLIVSIVMTYAAEEYYDSYKDRRKYMTSAALVRALLIQANKDMSKLNEEETEKCLNAIESILTIEHTEMPRYLMMRYADILEDFGIWTSHKSIKPE